MTLIQIVDIARTLLNETLNSARTFPDDTSTFWTDSNLTTYVNLCQAELQQEIIQADEGHFITQTFANVVGGTAEYTLPTGLIKVKRIEDVRQSGLPVEILPVGINQRGAATVFFDVSGAVVGGRYYLRGSQIVFTDTPTFTNASAIRLHYLYQLGDLSAGSDISEIPREHHRLMALGCAKYALLQQQTDPGFIGQEYEKGLAKMKQQIEDRQTQRPRGVVRVMTKGDDI